jgi:type VI secretion system protein ImpJ
MAADHRRVVWYEGMVLDPHHLQQWDRHQQATLNARLRAVTRFDWGLLALEVDEERLANGDLVVTAARGVMPDGLAFDLPAEAELPAPRPVQEAFPSTQERLAVVLATPALRPGGTNVLLEGAERRRETRFTAEQVTVEDETTGGDERTIEVARPNLSVRFGGEPMESYVTLPIAEVVRDGSGTFRLREEFVPPALTLAASRRLDGLAGRLAERLYARHAELAARWRQVTAQREISPADVTAQALLSAIAEFAPLVDHHRRAGSHPEAFFQTLLALAGRLSAAALEAAVTPRDLPAYSHAEPSSGFASLGEAIERMLGGAAPRANYTRVPLERRTGNLSHATLDASLLNGTGVLFLAARHPEFDPERLRQDLPHMLRVASPDTIDAVLRSYTRALPVEVTRQLPSALPVDARAGYFELQRRGPFWDAIRDAGALAVFVPSEFAGTDLEILALD